MLCESVGNLCNTISLPSVGISYIDSAAVINKEFGHLVLVACNGVVQRRYAFFICCTNIVDLQYVSK